MTMAWPPARVTRTSSSRPEAGAWPSVKTPVEKKAAKCPSGQGSFLPSSAWVSCRIDPARAGERQHVGRQVEALDVVIAKRTHERPGKTCAAAGVEHRSRAFRHVAREPAGDQEGQRVADAQRLAVVEIRPFRVGRCQLCRRLRLVDDFPGLGIAFLLGHASPPRLRMRRSSARSAIDSPTVRTR